MLSSNTAQLYLFNSILTKKDDFNKILETLNESFFDTDLDKKFFTHLRELYFLELDYEVEIFGINNDCEEYIQKILNLENGYSSSYIIDFFLSKKKSSLFKTLQKDLSSDLTPEEKEFKVNEVLEKLNEKIHKDELSDSKVSVQKYREYLDEILQQGNESGLIGISTGINALDEKTKGVKKQDYIVVAARPSQGKTAFVLKVFKEALIKDENPVFFSLEMQKEQLISRLLTQLNTSLGMEETLYGKNYNEKRIDIDEMLSYLEEKEFFIEDFIEENGSTKAKITVNDLRGKMKQIKKTLGDKKPGLIIVDYLQLLSPEFSRGKSTNDEMSEISKGLKNLGRAYQCPIIALSQLNRDLERRPDKRPQMSDLRDSGAIEQDADIIMFIYRPAVYLEKEIREQLKKQPENQGLLRELQIIQNQAVSSAEIIIGKQRNGPIGIVEAEFFKSASCFGDVNEFEIVEE